MSNLVPLWGKVLIKPDHDFTKTEDGVYKASKDSKIVIPESAAGKKVKDHITGTIVAFGPTAGIDDNGNRHHTFKVGQKVVYVGANVLLVRYEGVSHHFIQDEYIIASIED